MADKFVRQKHLTSDGRKAQPQERVGAMAPDADPDIEWPTAKRRAGRRLSRASVEKLRRLRARKQ